jgi:Raf kinase inhibitor-like YbhB/YbcL family protein
MDLILFLISILTVKSMEVTSPSFKNGGFIPLIYTCEGENINPAISIDNFPSETKSFVLIVEDPDAVKGTFDHWLIWNLEPGKNISENSAPGVEGKNGLGKTGYLGPCPPPGTGVHHYHFKVYALNKKLSLGTGADKKQLLETMKGNILTQGEMIGLYTKSVK